jgi:hypothetical protein
MVPMAARSAARPTTPWRAIARPSGLRSSARARVPAASSCGMVCVATSPRRGASARGRSAGATRRSTSARRPTRPARRPRGSIRISTAAPHAEVRLVRRTVAVTTSAASETHRTSAARGSAASDDERHAAATEESVAPRALLARGASGRPHLPHATSQPPEAPKRKGNTTPTSPPSDGSKRRLRNCLTMQPSTHALSNVELATRPP